MTNLVDKMTVADQKKDKSSGSLYGLLAEAKWAIVVLGSVICALLAFRPELSSLI